MRSLERRLAQLEQASGVGNDEPVVYSYRWRWPDGSLVEIARAEKRGDAWRPLEPADSALARGYRKRGGGIDADR